MWIGKCEFISWNLLAVCITWFGKYECWPFTGMYIVQLRANDRTVNETKGMKNEQKTVMNYSKDKRVMKHLTQFTYNSFKESPFGEKLTPTS